MYLWIVLGSHRSKDKMSLREMDKVGLKDKRCIEYLVILLELIRIISELKLYKA